MKHISTLYFLFILITFMSCEAGDPTPILNISKSEIHFDKNNTSTTIEISNNGEGELEWEVLKSSDNISVDKTTGTSASTLNITIDILNYQPGSNSESITILSNGGNKEISIIITIPTPPLLIVSETSIEFNKDKLTTFLDISNGGEEDLIWEVISPSENITIDKINGSNSARINIEASVLNYSLGTFSETLIINSNGGQAEIAITITSYNISGTWTGIYSWSCSPELTGQMEISYIIVDNHDGTFTGEVNLNNASSTFVDGFVNEPGSNAPEGKMYVYLYFQGVPGSYVENNFEGYIDIATLSMEGSTSNGDSAAYPGESEGCSADQGSSGSVTASLFQNN
ncbi:MAG: hypothetical protein OEW67_15135 [Cyclobacteriaceae bacterium]|nr:hypothetical protein [Cyclobacteriaceae bacterium]